VQSISTPPSFRYPHPPITPAPLSMQQGIYTTDQVLRANSGGEPRRASKRPRRSRSNRTIVGIIMGLIFLLAVSSLLAYLTIQTRQQNAISATATAQVSATNSVFIQQTQQAQNTQQTATALSVAATAQAKAAQQAIQATATAITNSTPVLRDPLNSPDGNDWPDDGTFCAFVNNRYVVNAHGNSTLQPCIASSSQMNYGAAAFQVDVTLIAGNDAGLIFRTSADGSQFYDFEITDQHQFYLRYRNNGKYTDLIKPISNSAILGSGGQNTLLILASGSDFRLFINHTFVGEAQDSTFASGQIGVAVGTLTSNSGEASFANLAVYNV
ncbi:MAG: hypothetical protein ACRDHZ_19145, partial [Ktedonobacteraceae bacterium]